MGFAIAATAARRGAKVHLVAAPTELRTPAGVIRHDVITALEMHEIVFDLIADADVIVKAAAVADFRPQRRSSAKVKKAAGVPEVTLTPNPDILAEIGAQRDATGRPAVLVGFAAETDDVEANALDKLRRKRCDLLVVNDVTEPYAGFGHDTNRVRILSRDGGRVDVPLTSKSEVAERLFDQVVRLLGGPRSVTYDPSPSDASEHR
jgi:phosphopantothenoylcysteine decarboxylase/phosphopantothenate--cysteine ligase